MKAYSNKKIITSLIDDHETVDILAINNRLSPHIKKITKKNSISLSKKMRLVPVLKFFLNSFDTSEFFNNYWEQKPLFLRRKNENRFERISSIDEITRNIVEEKFPAELFKLFFDGYYSRKPLPRYSSQLGTYNNFNYENLIKLIDKKKATLQLSSFNQYSPIVNRIVCELGEAFKCMVHANIYFTTKESRPTAYHWDLYDLFIIQLDGRKRWKIYEPRIVLPLARYYKTQYINLNVGTPTQQLTMSPGDVLYLPRGTPHRVKSLKGGSLHLTIGLFYQTWHDWLSIVVDRALEELSRDRSFRHFCPQLILGAEGDGVSRYQTYVIDAFIQKVKSLKSERLLEDSLIKDQIDSTNQDLSKKYKKINIELQTKFERIYSVHFLHFNSKNLILKFKGKSLVFPKQYATLLRYIVQNRSFSESDLSFNLKGSHIRGVLRRLTREGFLKISR